MSGADRRSARRHRWLVSIGAALLALALLTPLAIMAFGRDADQARRDTVAWAEENLALAFSARLSDEFDPPANTWQVNVVDGWSDPLGETW
ncbi:MAG: hypothetical protein AAFO29_19950, partial [Actinomycetota bacterium]